MKQLLQTIAKANQLSVIKALSFALIVTIHLLLIYIFIKYFQIKASLHNPLIPKGLADYSFQSYALKGLILSFGLPVISLLKYMKQNILVVVGAVTILVTYTFTDHFVEWY